jgi:MFS family permease
MVSSPFAVYALAIIACAICLGYLMHRYERNRSLAILLTNLLALTALLAIASKITWIG